MKNNIDDVIGQIKAQNVSVKRAVKLALFYTGQNIKVEIKKNAMESKSGQKYKALRYRSSAEGETSRRQKAGGKHDSVMFKATEERLDVGADKKISYLYYVERGTIHMKPRFDTSKAGNKIAKEKLSDNLVRALNNIIK
jgi:hypothetical protein